MMNTRKAKRLVPLRARDVTRLVKRCGTDYDKLREGLEYIKKNYPVECSECIGDDLYVPYKIHIKIADGGVASKDISNEPVRYIDIVRHRNAPKLVGNWKYVRLGQIR